MTPLRVCIDARLGAGQFGGVEQVVIGLAAALSRLEDGDEEYLFLTHPEHDEWIRPYLGGPCRLLPSRRSYPNRRAARGRLARCSSACRRSGVRFAVRPSDGTVERAGVDVVHFPFQDAFTTDDPQPLPAARPAAPPSARAVQRLGARAAGERSTAPTASGPRWSWR